MKKIQHSKSEESGISMLTDKDLIVFCPGVSTGGQAETRMAQLNRSRKIFATTIYQEDIEHAGETIAQEGLSSQIKLKMENIAKPLPYKDNFFDFVYARLILHYLSKQKLDITISNLYKATKPGGHLFVVVRSAKDWESKLKDATYNEITKQVTYPVLDSNGKPENTTSTKFFHTKESISEPITHVGYTIKYIREYKEQLYKKFTDDVPLYKPSTVIELLAKK